MIIASWNIEGRLSDISSTHRGSPDKIISFIKYINADIILLLEAHNDDRLDNKISQEFINFGYKIYEVPYEDDMKFRHDSIEDKSSLLLLSKLTIKNFKIIRLGNLRNALTFITYDIVTDKEIRLIGIHLDDRQEKTRIKQIKDLSLIINNSQIPTIVMGDFNAMHGSDIWPAGFLKSNIMKFISHFIIPDISSKAIGMAKGESLALLESSTSLVDLDPKHRPTTTPKMRAHQWLPSIRLMQIDHIYASKTIKSKNFKIYKDGGSDHRAISSCIELTSRISL
ncbi:MAG: endonuclease/exonuclease/phosphatase family protein [Candidatus Saccharibacteria bacterium]